MKRPPAAPYSPLLEDISRLLDEARQQTARTVNAFLTATYWEIGRRIVEYEQKGKKRAEYGSALLQRLSKDLTLRFGRGFGVDNLQRMRSFYQAYEPEIIYATLSRKSMGTEILSEKYATPSRISKDPAMKKKSEAASRLFSLEVLASVFPLSWSAYVRLLSVKSNHAREFYETEAMRGGWSVRQLERQINAQFYERTALSKNKAAMLRKGARPKPTDVISPEEALKDPYVLEFLGLKDEYSESDLEEALIRHLEVFLLELGGDFTFVARQKRLRVGDEWFQVDLVFFHRGLHCLVLIDLKLGKFTHADAGQMHMYLNYAREHWTRPEENPPVGLILCAYKDKAVAKYSLEGLPNKVLAAEYKTALPDEQVLAEELARTRKALDAREEAEKDWKLS
ncbi:MAG: DUF1016 domain-containing protein [bacterium]|nr:DUF1016 domain-containing protein [bacterium]